MCLHIVNKNKNKFCPVRLSVRTLDFHSRKRGSTPLSGTNINNNMIFIKQLPTESRKTRLLYLNGATSHTNAMFHLKSSAENFSDALLRNGVETYTFNYYGTGLDEKPDLIGNHNLEEIQRTIDIINDYQIEYVFGYSYGCAIAREAALKCNLKGLLLLDPSAFLHLEFQRIDNDDKIRITEKTLDSMLRNNGAVIDPLIYQDYVNAFLSSGELITATYPGLFFTEQSYLFKTKEHVDELYRHVPTKTFFTKNSIESVRPLYPDHVYYPNSSHWILVEPEMQDLFIETVKFIDLTLNMS